MSADGPDDWFLLSEPHIQANFHLRGTEEKEEKKKKKMKEKRKKRKKKEDFLNDERE